MQGIIWKVLRFRFPELPPLSVILSYIYIRVIKGATYTESEREVKRKVVHRAIAREENGCVDDESWVVSGNGFYDHGERRGATCGKLLQLHLSKR